MLDLLSRSKHPINKMRKFEDLKIAVAGTGYVRNTSCATPSSYCR